MTFIKTRTKNIYEDTRSGIYYIRIRRKGKKPLNKSLDTKNYKNAQTKADTLVREYLGHEQKRTEHVLFKDEVPRFLESFKVRVSAGTLLRTKSVIRLYLMPYWQNKIISHITPEDWDAYLSAEKLKRNRNFTNDKKAMDNILAFAVQNKRMIARPKLTDPTPASEAGRELSESEIQKLSNVAKGMNPRVYAGMCIAYGAGCRIGEVVSLSWKLIDLEERYMTVKGKSSPRAKKSGIRKVAIGAFVIETIRAVKNETPWVFPMPSDPARHMSTNGLDNDWQIVKKAAGVDCRFHDLRHTYITKALRAGHSIVTVAKQVGSSVRTITKVYEHLNIKDLADLGDVVKSREIMSVETV